MNPVRREEIRFAKDNDEWTKDEKDEGGEGRRRKAKTKLRKATDEAEERKGNRRFQGHRSAEADRQRRNRP